MQTNVSAFLCESVRREHDGKHTLVGIIFGEINATTEEFSENLSLFASFENVPTGSHISTLKVTHPEGEKKISKYKIEIDKEQNYALLVVPDIEVSTRTSGKISVDFKFDHEKRWRNLTSLLINLAPDEK